MRVSELDSCVLYIFNRANVLVSLKMNPKPLIGVYLQVSVSAIEAQRCCWL